MARRKKQAAKPKKRSREAVALQLKAWCAEHGVLDATKLRQTDEPLYTATRRRFGSLRDAAKELDLPFHERRRSIPEEEILQRIQKRHADELPIHAGAVERADRRLYYHARQRFGTWEAAVKASSLAGAVAGVKRVYTPESLGQELRAWVDANGPLNATVLRRSASRLLAAAVHRYGTLERTAKALDLPFAARIQRWAPERIIRAIHERAEAKQSLLAVDVIREDRSLYNASLRYFGSWRRAVGASGMNYAKIGLRPAWTEEAIGQELRLAFQAVGPLAARKLKTYDQGLLLAAVRRYGSVRNAAREFGLPFGGRQAVRK